ncbi:hypothetical protein BMS3Abin03_02251 [bacterium BMS3Abin03]|nr:hypothetical protein BMS3Abin03_02251 [bacterium BMS3Abin03]
MKIPLFLICIFWLTGFCLSQEKIESDIDYAYQNAKKGIYWALSNIPEKKSKIEGDLVADDRLYAHVRLDKEINGVKVKSKGFYFTNTVEITIYRSFDSLKEYGYLKEEEKEE